MLRDQAIDIGLATMIGRLPEGVKLQPLVSLTMMILVPEKSDIHNADQIWERDRIDLPLISLHSSDPLCRLFQDHLQNMHVDWYPALELSTLDLVTRYVSEGYGAGLALSVPAISLPPGVRAIPLLEFPRVPFGAIWMGKLPPLGDWFIEEAEKLARELFEAPPKEKEKKK
jgi:DNA-binding transcriptional LysR family regulator